MTEIEAVTECTFACICPTVFRMFSCLQINCHPFYLRQLLKIHPFDWLIKIYPRTEGQGIHHKMVSLQPMPGFSPLFIHELLIVGIYKWTLSDQTDKRTNSVAASRADLLSVYSLQATVRGAERLYHYKHISCIYGPRPMLLWRTDLSDSFTSPSKRFWWNTSPTWKKQRPSSWRL